MLSRRCNRRQSVLNPETHANSSGRGLVVPDRMKTPVDVVWEHIFDFDGTQNNREHKLHDREELGDLRKRFWVRIGFPMRKNSVFDICLCDSARNSLT